MNPTLLKGWRGKSGRRCEDRPPPIDGQFIKNCGCKSMIIGGDYNDTGGANDTLPLAAVVQNVKHPFHLIKVRDTTPVNYTSLSVLETAEVCWYRQRNDGTMDFLITGFPELPEPRHINWERRERRQEHFTSWLCCVPSSLSICLADEENSLSHIMSWRLYLHCFHVNANAKALKRPTVSKIDSGSRFTRQFKQKQQGMLLTARRDQVNTLCDITNCTQRDLCTSQGAHWQATG